MKKRAFTLIELLVVISIIAVLLSVMVPALGRAKEVARRIVCAANMKSLGQGVFAYAASNSDRLPLGQYNTALNNGTGTGEGGQPTYSYVMFYLQQLDKMSLPPKQRLQHSFENGGKWGYGELFVNDLVEDGEVFYCAAAPNPPNNNQHFAYKYYSNMGAQNFPYRDELAVNPARTRSSYVYVPQNSRKMVEPDSLWGLPSGTVYPATAKKVAELSSSSVMGCDVLFNIKWLPHKKGSGQKAAGVNALFSDGSVAFSNNPEAFSTNIWGRMDDASPPTVIANLEKFRLVLSLLEY